MMGNNLNIFYSPAYSFSGYLFYFVSFTTEKNLMIFLHRILLVLLFIYSIALRPKAILILQSLHQNIFKLMVAPKNFCSKQGTPLLMSSSNFMSLNLPIAKAFQTLEHLCSFVWWQSWRRASPFSHMIK